MKIGVFGTGHLGKVHLRCLKETPFVVSGFVDPDDDIAESIQSEFNIKRFKDEEALITASDAIDIVSPTMHHYEIASKAIKYGKHVFIEKPVTRTIGEAKDLVALVEKYGVVAQVGHVERYNPAFQSLSELDMKPRFIESHRLANFNPRGNDVSVVLDLMIHDLDLILSLVDDEVIDIKANGVRIINATPDICNARLTFRNGCVANVTASRISMKNMRKVRLFQEDAYISIDFLEKNSQVIKLHDTQSESSTRMEIDTYLGKKYVSISMPETVENNAIEAELMDFYLSITERKPTLVGIKDGYRALELAARIEQVLENEEREAGKIE